MADQTTLRNCNGSTEAPARAIGRNVSGFAHDLSALADLQFRLLSLDLKQALSRLTMPVVLAVSAAALLLGCLPVLLLGLGWLLVEYADWMVSWSFLLVAGCAILLAGAMLGLAYSRVRHSFDTLNRSRDEFVRNVNWLKSVMQHPHATPTAPSAPVRPR